MNRVRWTQRALRDLVALGDFIAQDNPGAARAWVERLREHALIAAQAPKTGRKAPEINRDDIRETFLRSYRIVYRVVANAIVVLTVIEGHRRLPSVDSSDEPLAKRTSKPESRTNKTSVGQLGSNTGSAKRAGARVRPKKAH